MLTIYDATWSNIRSDSSYDIEYTYTGRRLDHETGLYYYRHRVLEAELGRFLSRDPVGYRDGLSLFGAHCAPGNTDAAGLCRTDKCCCCAESLKFSVIRKLHPGVNVTKCFGIPKVVGVNSYGNEFLVNLRFRKKESEEDAPCGFEWWEAASVDWTTQNGIVVLKKGMKIEQVSNLGEKVKSTRQWNEDYRRAKCPAAAGNAFATDCPIAHLLKEGDGRLLCIEIFVTSTCKSCTRKTVKMHIKQKCQFKNGKRSCTITEEPCTASDWKEFGIDMEKAGPPVWKPSTPQK